MPTSKATFASLLRATFAFLVPTLVAAAAGAEVQDSWSPLLHWRATGNLESSGGVPAGWYVSPVHAAVLSNGHLLLIARAREEEKPVRPTPTLVGSFRMDPGAVPDSEGSVWVDEEAVPVECGGTRPALELPGLHDFGEAPGRPDSVAPAYPESGPCGGDGLAFADHIGCSGHVQTSDGRLFVVGGTRALIAVGSDEHLAAYGVPNGFLFDPDGGWQRISQHLVGRGAQGKALRWYSTTTRLANARILVTAGFERVDSPVLNRSVEVWDPGSDAEPWRLLADHAEAPPEIVSPNYPHVFVLPSELRRDERSFDILMLGAAGLPVLFSADPGVPSADRWWVSSHSRPGSDGDPQPSRSASTVLLPLRLARGASGYSNGTLLTAGGGGDAERQIDRYDPVRDSWGPSIAMGAGRSDPSTVLLPDLAILVVAGNNADAGDGEGERRAEYLDPVSGNLEPGSSAMGEARGYHSVTLLLPDGRVLVGSGFPALVERKEQPAFRYLSPPYAKEQPTFRYLSPPYMDEPRPRITVAPAAVHYGERFGITWTGDGELKEANLLALGSMTHAVDMGQRAIQIAIDGMDQSAGTANLVAPSEASWAPPGHYMLILLDERRIPSEAHILHLGPGSPTSAGH